MQENSETGTFEEPAVAFPDGSYSFYSFSWGHSFLSLLCVLFLLFSFWAEKHGKNISMFLGFQYKATWLLGYKWLLYVKSHPFCP